MLYEVAGPNGPIAVAAVSLWNSDPLTGADVGDALAPVPAGAQTDIVHVVNDIPVTNW